MAGRLVIPQYMPAEDQNGLRLPGAKLYVYVNETTNLATTYTTDALSVANSNPVIANAAGVFPPIWAVDSSTFSVSVTDALGVPIVSYSGVDVTLDADTAAVILAEAAAQAAEGFADSAEAALAEIDAFSGDLFTNKADRDLNNATADQAPTEQIFEQNGARINRFNDRILLGGATACDGLFPNVEKDWLTVIQEAAGLGSGSVLTAQFAGLTNESEAAGIGLLGGAQTLHMTGAGPTALGVTGFAIANNTDVSGLSAWGFYGEAWRMAGVVAASIYGMELDLYNQVASITPTPYQQGDTTGLQIGAGAGLSGVSQFDCAAAIQIVANGVKWKAGVNLLDGALDADGIFTKLPQGVSSQVWYNGAGDETGRIVSSNTSAATATRIDFGAAGLQVAREADASTIAYFFPVAAATSYLTFSSSTTDAPIVGAGGSATDIDLLLAPKGAGMVKFGAYTAGAVSQAGYVSIKDSGGVTRRLLVG